MKLLHSIFPRKEQKNRFGSLFVSMDRGLQLFNQLKIRCHPDKFIGTDKQELAEELFKLVQQYSTDYEWLVKLKERIDTELY